MISRVNIERKYYGLYTKGSERGSKTYHCKNAIKHKEKQSERKGRTKNLPDIQIGNDKFLLVGNYFPRKWTKLYNQKMDWKIKKKSRIKLSVVYERLTLDLRAYVG